jgi:hypothetical protein
LNKDVGKLPKAGKSIKNSLLYYVRKRYFLNENNSKGRNFFLSVCDKCLIQYPKSKFLWAAQITLKGRA